MFCLPRVQFEAAARKVETKLKSNRQMTTSNSSCKGQHKCFCGWWYWKTSGTGFVCNLLSFKQLQSWVFNIDERVPYIKMWPPKKHWIKTKPLTTSEFTALVHNTSYQFQRLVVLLCDRITWHSKPIKTVVSDFEPSQVGAVNAMFAWVNSYLQTEGLDMSGGNCKGSEKWNCFNLWRIQGVVRMPKLYLLNPSQNASIYTVTKAVAHFIICWKKSVN